MPVAKSYQELEIVGDVFVSSGRQYVNVKLKSGKTKTVRWYTDSEYRKMYPEAVASAASDPSDPYYKITVQLRLPHRLFKKLLARHVYLKLKASAEHIHLYKALHYV